MCRELAEAQRLLDELVDKIEEQDGVIQTLGEEVKEKAVL